MIGLKKIAEVLMIIVFILLLFGCKQLGLESDEENTQGDSTVPTDVKPPSVSEISPNGDAKDVSIDSTIMVTFNEAIDPESLTLDTENETCTGNIRVSYNDFTTCVKMDGPANASDDKTTFTLTPATHLYRGTYYNVEVKKGYKDLAGNMSRTERTLVYTGFLTQQDADDVTGTTTDHFQGLVWQDEETQIEKNWDGADTYCKELTLDGTSDWRLPALRELSTLDYRFEILRNFDLGDEESLCHWAESLSDTSNYWNSQTEEWEKGGAYKVCIDQNRDSLNPGMGTARGEVHYVRCVRP